MGKNFTAASKEDNIYTPYSMTRSLFENEHFDYDKDFLEPASGKHAIVDVISEFVDQPNLIYYDINDGIDFFDETIKFDYIVTNPPYSKLDQFIVKAKQVATEKFAFLCKITHLGGVDRFNSNIFRDPEYPLTKIYMFTRQANLKFCKDYPELREDGKYPAGMYHFCFLVWEKKYYTGFDSLINPPSFHWIDNNKYILRKHK